MEKTNQKKSHKQDRICKKIFKAITQRSPVRKNDSSNGSNPVVKDIDIQTKVTKPVEHVGTAKFSVKAKKFESKKSSGGAQMEDRFTDYIKRAKLKIRAMTNVRDILSVDAGETEIAVAQHSSKDSFSDYIKTTKKKITATSSTEGGSRSKNLSMNSDN